MDHPQANNQTTLQANQQSSVIAPERQSVNPSSLNDQEQQTINQILDSLVWPFNASSHYQEQSKVLDGWINRMGSEPSPIYPQAAGCPLPKTDSTTLPSPAGIKEEIITALKTIYDPEIPVNIYDIGLIYNIDISPSGVVALQMTLTTPACPVAESLPPEVEKRVCQVPGVTQAKVEIVWDPPWTMDKMSEAAKLELGFM